MALRLFKTEKHPTRIAINDVDTFVIGGTFFLDFSRPLELRRWLGVGPATGAFVPVIHERERTGGYVVGIERDNPYFSDIRKLWKQRYPSDPPAPESIALTMPEVRHCVAYSGNTEVRTFPLILIFGREYNSSGPLIPNIGKYDFRESRGASFWNRTYALIARACPGSGQLKQNCSDLGASPLVFANVSPQSIPNQVASKEAIREDIPPSLISDHLNQVFDLPIIQRVQVVLLSVGSVPNASLVLDVVTSKCRSRGIHLITLPYLGSRSSNRDVEKFLSDEDRSALQRIMSRFFASKRNEG